MFKLILRCLAWFAISCVSPVYAGYFYTVPSITFHSLSADSARFEGLTIDLALGYGGWSFFGLNLDGEVFASPFQALKIHSNSGDIGNLAPSMSYGFSVMPTLPLDLNMRTFLRLGLVWSRFEGLDGRNRGEQIGIGVDTQMWTPMTLRVEFDYTRYNNMDDVDRLTDGSFKLGLVYCY